MRYLNNELLVSEMQKRGVTIFVSEIKRVEDYPDFEKFARPRQHGLQGFIVKNIEVETAEVKQS